MVVNRASSGVFSCDRVSRYGGVALELPLSQVPLAEYIYLPLNLAKAAVVGALVLWIVLGCRCGW